MGFLLPFLSYWITSDSHLILEDFYEMNCIIELCEKSLKNKSGGIPHTPIKGLPMLL